MTLSAYAIRLHIKIMLKIQSLHIRLKNPAAGYGECARYSVRMDSPIPDTAEGIVTQRKRYSVGVRLTFDLCHLTFRQSYNLLQFSFKLPKIAES